MQTFLPYPSMTDSLKALDNARLNKQILEAEQILDSLEFGSRWENHPAVKMWEGSEEALIKYRNIGLKIWEKRGGKGDRRPYSRNPHTVLPWWWGFEPFHESHAGNLLRKDFGFYKPRVPKANPHIFYLWPKELLQEQGLAVFYITTPQWATEKDMEENYKRYSDMGAWVQVLQSKRKFSVPFKYEVAFKKRSLGPILYNPIPRI
jgi:hypothetical protein